jgi:hypothetical protein
MTTPRKLIKPTQLELSAMSKRHLLALGKAAGEEVHRGLSMYDLVKDAVKWNWDRAREEGVEIFDHLFAGSTSMRWYPIPKEKGGRLTLSKAIEAVKKAEDAPRAFRDSIDAFADEDSPFQFVHGRAVSDDRVVLTYAHRGRQTFVVRNFRYVPIRPEVPVYVVFRLDDGFMEIRGSHSVATALEGNRLGLLLDAADVRRSNKPVAIHKKHVDRLRTEFKASMRRFGGHHANSTVLGKILMDIQPDAVDAHLQSDVLDAVSQLDPDTYSEDFRFDYGPDGSSTTVTAHVSTVYSSMFVKTVVDEHVLDVIWRTVKDVVVK